MDNLITDQNIKDELDVNIKVKMRLPTQAAVDKWINRQQDIILNYIASHTWGGISIVEGRINTYDDYKQIVIKAVYEQIDYIVFNSGIDSSKINGITRRNGVFNVANSNSIKSYQVAPLAKETLLNNGILYAGRG